MSSPDVITHNVRVDALHVAFASTTRPSIFDADMDTAGSSLCVIVQPSSGSTTSIVLAFITGPVVVNDTFTLVNTPGVSMLVFNVNAPVSIPAVIAFVDTNVGPSVTAPELQ